MKYILTENWSLRGYSDTPYMLFDRERKQQIQLLTKRAFRVLVACDGQQEVDITDASIKKVIEKFLESDVIKESDGSVTITQSQKYSYNAHEILHLVKFAITSKCNYNCLHCFNSAETERLTAEYSKEKVFSLLEELEQAGLQKIRITGGEPLLHPNFLEIIEKCGELHIEVEEILTNGSLLTDEILSRLKEMNHVKGIGISFDGLGTHDYIRNKKGAEANAIDAITRAIQSGIKVKVNINVNEKSIPRLVETCRFMSDLGASRIFMIRTSETPKWFHLGEKFTSFDNYFLKLGDVVDRYLAEDWKPELQMFGSIFLIRVDGGLERGGRAIPVKGDLTYTRKHGCGIQAFLGHEGIFLPCDAFEGLSIKHGVLLEKESLYSRSLHDFLSGSEYANYMGTKLCEYQQSNPECKECEWLRNCRGGCCAFGLGATGNILGASPLTCIYFRSGHHQMINDMIEAYANKVLDTQIITEEGISLYRQKQKEAFAENYEVMKESLPTTAQVPSFLVPKYVE